MEIDYYQLVQLSKDWEIQYGFGDNRQLVMINTGFPSFSTAISEGEFFWLKELVEEMNLTRGFEVATGFGISSLAAGLSFKENGGKLVTMDAHNETAVASGSFGEVPSEEASGLKSVKQLVKYFNLEGVVFPTIGWSPQDNEDRINTVFSEEETLDYVFIDADHSNEASRRDFDAIKHRINKDHFLVAFHDSHDVLETIAYAEEFLGAKAETDFPPPFGQNLSIIRKFTPKRTKSLVTFANNYFYENRRSVTIANSSHLFDKAYNYDASDIENEFISKNEPLFSFGRGFGYWIWKPYLILKTFENMNDGDLLCYLDSGDFIDEDSLNKGFNFLVNENQDYAFVQLKLDTNRHWVKRDCYIIMDCDEEKYWECKPVTAACHFWKKTEKATRFLEEWLYWAQNPNVITDIPNIHGLDNLEGFREHRHDQAILTNLVIKHDAHYWPYEHSEWPWSF